jgi:hypothetical protein
LRPLCFTDCEAICLNRRTRLPWEVAIILRAPDGTETERVWMAIDPDLSEADPKSLEMNHFWERHPMGGVAKWDDVAAAGIDAAYTSEIAREIDRWTRGAVLIGAVASFDEETYARLLYDHGLLPTWHFRPRCVETLAIGWLAGQGREIPPLDGRSDDLYAALGIDTSTYARHTALGDTRLARDVWDLVFDIDR